MKNLFLILIIILFVPDLYSQNTGTQMIFNSGDYKIALSNSINSLNSGFKNLFIQLGRYNYQSSQNESGRYLKLNKNSNNWFIPLNGFINAAWGMDPYWYTIDCQPIPFFAVSPIDSNQIIKFVVTPAASCPDATTHYTTNCGVSFSNAPFNCGGVMIFPFGGDYNPKKNNELIFGYGNQTSGIFKSTNAGVNWSIIFDISNLRQNGGAYNSLMNYGYGFVKYNPFDTAFVYANGINNIFISTNGGYSFTELPVKWMRDIIFSRKDSVIYGFNNYKIYRSYNKGLSWDSSQSMVRFSAFEVNPDLANILYGGDSSGVYVSTNFGSNWSLYNNSFSPSKVVIGISKDPGTADTFFVVTTSKVYKVWASFLVGMQNSNTNVPEKFVLHQNFPNPFNAETRIKFEISSNVKSKTSNDNPPFTKGGLGGFVSLKVFDILGKEVAVLVNESLQPGTYEVTFDGSNLPSGIYFYQLRTGNFVETKKLILLK